MLNRYDARETALDEHLVYPLWGDEATSLERLSAEIIHRGDDLTFLSVSRNAFLSEYVTGDRVILRIAQALEESAASSRPGELKPLELHLALKNVGVDGAQTLAALLSPLSGTSSEAILSRKKPIIGVDLTGTRFASLRAQKAFWSKIGKAWNLTYLFAKDSLDLTGQTEKCASEMQSFRLLVATDLTLGEGKGQKYLARKIEATRESCADLLQRAGEGQYLNDGDKAEMVRLANPMAYMLRGNQDFETRHYYWKRYEKETGRKAPPMAAFAKHYPQAALPKDSPVVNLSHFRGMTFGSETIPPAITREDNIASFAAHRLARLQALKGSAKP